MYRRAEVLTNCIGIKKLRQPAGVFFEYHVLRLMAFMLCMTVSTAVTFVFAIAVVLHCVVVPVVAPVAVFPWSRVIGCIFVASTIVDAVV